MDGRCRRELGGLRELPGRLGVSGSGLATAVAVPFPLGVASTAVAGSSSMVVMPWSTTAPSSCMPPSPLVVGLVGAHIALGWCRHLRSGGASRPCRQSSLAASSGLCPGFGLDRPPRPQQAGWAAIRRMRPPWPLPLDRREPGSLDLSSRLRPRLEFPWSRPDRFCRDFRLVR